MKDCRLKRILLRVYYFTLDIPQKVSNQYTQFYIKYHPVSANKIVFMNFYGKGYGDNPKYIAEEIHKQGLDWDLVWLVRDDSVEVPEYVRKVIYRSNAGKREISTARIRVTNVRDMLGIQKKKDQVYLQTWHAGLTFKWVEGQVEDKIDPEYIKGAKEEGKHTDAIISSCRIQSDEFKKYFWLNADTEILETGLPRNDPLFRQENNGIICKKVRNQLGIHDDSRIILYMPTFRDDRSIESYLLDFGRIKTAFENRFGKRFSIVIRLHPNVAYQFSSFSYNERLVNGSSYTDVQELYIASDYLITDYSTAAFDYALLDKPVFLCALDYEKYKRERGLNAIYDQCPFPHTYGNEELIQCIENFSSEEYQEKMEKFRGKWNSFDQGNAAELVVSWMKQKMAERK